MDHSIHPPPAQADRPYYFDQRDLANGAGIVILIGVAARQLGRPVDFARPGMLLAYELADQLLQVLGLTGAEAAVDVSPAAAAAEVPSDLAPRVWHCPYCPYETTDVAEGMAHIRERQQGRGCITADVRCTLCHPEPCSVPDHSLAGESPDDSAAIVDANLRAMGAAGLDDDAIVIAHGPLKPPYGSPERAAWDAEHAEPCAFPGDQEHDHEMCRDVAEEELARRMGGPL
jgi:hypothetical protein